MPRSGVVAVALASLVITGCASGEVGLGLPTQRHGDTYPGERQEIRGALDVADNGCLNLVVAGAMHFVIWPAGSELDDRVRLVGGEVIAEGDTVVGTGAYTPTAPLVANRDGYWAHAIGFCDPDAAVVIVLDAARLAR